MSLRARDRDRDCSRRRRGGARIVGVGAAPGGRRGKADLDRLRLRAAQRLLLPAPLPGRAGRGQGARRQAELHPDRRGRHRGDFGAHDADGDRAEARRHRRRRFRHQRRRSLHQAGGRRGHSRLCQPVGTGPMEGGWRVRLRRAAGSGSRPRRGRAPGAGGRQEHPLRHQRARQSLSSGDLQGPRREVEGARRHVEPISNCRRPTSTDQAKVSRDIGAYLQSHKDIDGVFTENAAVGTAATAAVEAARPHRQGPCRHDGDLAQSRSSRSRTARSNSSSTSSPISTAISAWCSPPSTPNIGLAPVGPVSTGPSVVDKTNIDKILKVFDTYPNVIGSK